MKHGEIRSIAHNAADSLASGICLMIGIYDVDVFAEAAQSPDGAITVDFLQGRVVGARPDPWLRAAVRRYRDAVAERFARHGSSLEDQVRDMKVRFWSDHLGPRFAVTVEDSAGRRSTTEYGGRPGKRVL